MDLRHKIAKLTELNKSVHQELKERADIKASKQYEALESQIKQLKESQSELLSGVPDNSVYFGELKNDIMLDFKAQGITSCENVTAKVRKRKEVSVNGVLNVMGGDIDQLIVMSGITQKNLKDFASLSDNGGIKRELLGCIKETGQDITDLIIS